MAGKKGKAADSTVAMPDKKRKAVDSTKDRTKSGKKPNTRSRSLGGGGDAKRRRSGPRLPAQLRNVLRVTKPGNDSDENINSDEANDFYEYEEPLPEEESGKNRRFDHVENYLLDPSDPIEDENVSSDEDGNNNDYDGREGRVSKIENSHGRRGSSEQLSDEVEDDERHSRMLQAVSGMPSEAFEGKKKKKKNVVISEAYPESEFNPSRDVLNGDGQVSFDELIEALDGKPGFSEVRKQTRETDKNSTSIQAPLPKVEREKLERKVGYENSKKDITKWEPLVKMNREAPSLTFDEDINLGFSTVGAIASGFEPRTEFEKKMALLVNDDKVKEAHNEDGSKLLELNKISAEEYMEDRNRIAKMRSLLFLHEIKSKRIKKIKSKTYHRLLKKDRLKSASAEMLMDPEAAKEEARKQEFKRAEERMTLKHKNSSKWAKRILQRGLNAQDEGTRAAINEQLHQHALLSRKMNTMKDSSSSGSDDSDEEDVDENSAGSDQDDAAKLIAKAKEKTLKVLQEDDEVPTSGVLSLPFMVRGLKKRKEEAVEEAKLALQDYESSLKKLENTSEEENAKVGITSGRRVFGAAKRDVPEPKPSNKMKTDNYYRNSDSEDDLDENIDVGNATKNDLQKDVNVDSGFLDEDAEVHQDSVFKSFDDVVRDPRPKTSYDVAIFASGTWKKMKKGNGVDANIKKSTVVGKPVLQNQEELAEESDTDSEGHMVDGILSAGSKPSYELPSQEELVRLAFAGDDVEDDFEKDKQEILNEENPEPEKPNLIPGWGQWTHVQKKKGVPSWMLEEHATAKRKREEALKKRKDAHLKHVIISEKLDKKAEKLHTKALPYPFTSKEVFEQSIRVPVGPEYNPATSVGALNQPEVKKKSGIIIKPIKFQEVNPHENTDEHKRSGNSHKTNKRSGGGGGKRKGAGARPVVVKS